MNWRTHILKEFTPQVARLTLVADPDGLLVEEGMMQAIRERGFELLTYEDPIAFRFVYESRYRSHWDAGAMTDLVVLLNSPVQHLNRLPFDLLQQGRQLSFNLGELFPNLSYPVIATLDRADLDALYQAQERYEPEPLGDHATKDFVLRHVFQIAPELIEQPSDLLRVLLRRHHQGQRLPKGLDDRFIQLLRQNQQFEEWPLETIVADRTTFFAFLQERWPHFVGQWLKANSASLRLTPQDELTTDATTHPVPELPFDHNDVRVYIDNLFLEGFLKPVGVLNDGDSGPAEKIHSTWILAGLHTDIEADRTHRSARLIKSLQQQLPVLDARNQAWLAFAHGWAELVVLWHQLSPETRTQQQLAFDALRDKMDAAFMAWVEKRYSGLHSLPATRPTMLHHLPRHLAHELEIDHKGKVALVVLDGLALDQWVILREVLAQQNPELGLREESIFAWLPTTTSVSRQALFAGKPPIFFPATIHMTGKEPVLWSQFWVDQGIARAEVAYLKGLGDDESLAEVERQLADPKIRVAGLVVDKVDRIMHGMELGTAGMHNQVKQWTERGFITKLLNELLDRGFGIVITSDHGNIEATGCGRPTEGAIADLRGERVRVYPNDALRRTVHQQYPISIEWPAVGLPDNYFPLLAGGRSAFITSGQHLVGHGGISIEELIVPLVFVERRVS
ncbi:MAG: BREX-3 system phosphatase PglZ [Burkholderiaceae bacterium]|nr:BREX-3 system phosphatase PglZ [Burkholderiaceae bacterium]